MSDRSAVCAAAVGALLALTLTGCGESKATPSPTAARGSFAVTNARARARELVPGRGGGGRCAAATAGMAAGPWRPGKRVVPAAARWHDRGLSERHAALGR